MRACLRAAFILALVAFAVSAAHAGKLKGFYSGSGGITQDVHRVVLIEFAEDGTAILQQNWAGKDPQAWHAHWTQNGKQVTLTFDPVKGSPSLAPLALNIKRGSLVPTTWDSAALGVLGPPTLAPFGGKNVQTHSVAGCVTLNTHNPVGDCVQWDSRTPPKSP
jgi:hypothetical protein